MKRQGAGVAGSPQTAIGIPLVEGAESSSWTHLSLHRQNVLNAVCGVLTLAS
jgi:hypothetical protein